MSCTVKPSSPRLPIHGIAFLDQAAGEIVEIDARPSDAIALAVRARVPIFIAEAVMDHAAILPETDTQLPEPDEARRKKDKTAKDEEGLDIFREFVEGLDMESFGD